MKARPFIKWAGGKTRVLPQILQLFPSEFNKFYEPFLGGGALYFSISPQNGCLNDMNPALIESYIHIRDDLKRLLANLAGIESHYYSLETLDEKADYYYCKRLEFNTLNTKSLQRTALFIFLNKTGFNGMYRENRAGEYNIPFGKRKQPIICDTKNLFEVSRVLKQIDIKCGSYEQALESAAKGDFVYLDPPYEPINITSNFTQYQAGGFLQDDQRKLSEVFHKLSEKGCFVMMSNSTADLIKDLYSKYTINEIAVSRGINANTSKRGKIKELIITNYAPEPGKYLASMENPDD